MQFKQIPMSVGLRDPETQNEVDMTVYVVFYRTPKIRGRIIKVAEAFAATVDEIPPINDTNLFLNS